MNTKLYECLDTFENLDHSDPIVEAFHTIFQRMCEAGEGGEYISEDNIGIGITDRTVSIVNLTSSEELLHLIV